MLVWLERHGIDFTAVLAIAAALLLLGLVSPASSRLPRAPTLAVAGLGGGFFVLYGLLTAAAALLGRGYPGITPWLIVVGVVAFCGTGTALVAYAWALRRPSAR